MLNLHKMPPFTFPENFLWGSGSAGYQIEGNNTRCQWWHMEQEGTIPGFREPSGMACNSWNLFDEDLRLLKELGHRAYRFSIEWSRIEPEEGRHDSEALQKYLDMLRKLKDAGIFTCVTLLHGTHPQWFEEKGGFRREENIAFFLRHIRYLVPEIAPYADSWIIMNEINLGPMTPEEIKHRQLKLKAFGLGSAAVKEFSPAPRSMAHACIPCTPLRPDDPMDQAGAAYANWVTNDYFYHAARTGEIVLPGLDMMYVPELKDSCDYWGVNYYHRRPVDSRNASFMAEKFHFNAFRMCLRQALDREFCPEHFVNVIGKITDKPIWITENGICTDTDEFRIIYIMQQLEAMRTAMNLHHADIRAYFHWSLLDNYEWGSYDLPFGLCSVDRKTFRRTPKPSAYFLRDVIAANGMSGEIFQRHTPTLPHFALLDFETGQTRTAAETQA